MKSDIQEKLELALVSFFNAQQMALAVIDQHSSSS
jgi:hypothetical protein